MFLGFLTHRYENLNLMGYTRYIEHRGTETKISGSKNYSPNLQDLASSNRSYLIGCVGFLVYWEGEL